ncbi:unnamed protein product [Gongylonema pulchrum]|uniref:Uncharacterized protein n=1 Tax=Gongylonema pulchrum TaxID=637853 RepID=A0A183F0U4_9BILA|nr:unnamed protein product [Gongylonema pulchrum]
MGEPAAAAVEEGGFGVDFCLRFFFIRFVVSNVCAGRGSRCKCSSVFVDLISSLFLEALKTPLNVFP